MGSLRSFGQERWGIILAGGDGTRLRPLTRLIAGDDRPKQFCPVLGRETLLSQTVRRIGATIPPTRTLLVVTRSHERYYAPLLPDLGPLPLVIQPENRGTAPAILYALLRIAAVAPLAWVALFPSDHYVSDDHIFMTHVEAAFEALSARPDLVALLGMVERAAPDLFQAFAGIQPALHTTAERAVARSRYARFAEVNFSRDVLAASPASLAVLPVTGVRWSDWGDPGRVLTTMARLGVRPEWAGALVPATA